MKGGIKQPSSGLHTDINEHEVCWCSLHPRTRVLKTTASIYQQIRAFSCSRHCFPHRATRGGLKSSSVSVGEEVNYSYTILPRTRCSRGLMRNLFLSLWAVKRNIFNPSCAIAEPCEPEKIHGWFFTVLLFLLTMPFPLIYAGWDSH